MLFELKLCRLQNLMYCYYKCSVAFSNGAVCWYVIVVFPDHTPLLCVAKQKILPNLLNF